MESIKALVESMEGPVDFYAAVEAFEAALIRRAFARTANDDGSTNKSKAAVDLNLKRTALVMMCQKKNID
jgi:hypothetical protein